MLQIFAVEPAAAKCSRIRSTAFTSDRIALIELILLLACGTLAAIAIIAISPSWKIPGSAIFRAGVPMLLGLAIVPRRLSGSLMSLAAASTFLVMAFAGLATIPVAAFSGTIALGFMLDCSVRVAPSRRLPMYLRAVMAGLLANSIAYIVRYAMFVGTSAVGEAHTLQSFGPTIFASFGLCGALMGLLYAPLLFRIR